MEQNEIPSRTEKTDAELYKEYEAVFAEEQAALAALREFLAASARQQRAEPETAELRKRIERMDAAVKNTHVALNAWLAAMEKNRGGTR